jgi:flavin-dependent dehydrogenase
LAGARLLAATAWRSHPITRHDGPLSIRRSFTVGEARRLARASGLPGVRVLDVRPARDGSVAGVRVLGPGGEREIRARLVVGADGLRSVVSRRLGLLARRPRLRKLALTAHVRGWDPAAGGEVRVSGRAACVGIAPVGQGLANVTVVVPHQQAHQVDGDADAYFDAALAREGLGGLVREDAVLASGPFDWPVRAAVAEGALLVGDAAGYYDPFTGQGIYRALHGGELAAAGAHQALEQGDLSVRGLDGYERARRRAFGPGERMQHLVEAFLSRPRLLGALARRCAAHPRLGDALVRVTGDVAVPGSLVGPLFGVAAD